MSLDNVSRITSDSSPVTDAADVDVDEEHTVTAMTSPGNLDIALRILAGMCDGQYTDLQASSQFGQARDLSRDPSVLVQSNCTVIM